MSFLSISERHSIARSAEILSGDPAMQLSGRVIADSLRAQMPDLDDITIGRVLFGVSKLLSGVAASDRDNRLLAGVSAQFLAATAEMTVSEWQDTPR